MYQETISEIEQMAQPTLYDRAVQAFSLYKLKEYPKSYEGRSTLCTFQSHQ